MASIMTEEMDDATATAAARWLAEALETGNPLAPFPPELAPRTPLDGARVAAALLEETGQLACGVRLLLRPGGAAPVVGPMLETRLLRGGSPVALAGMRHPRATAALVAVLAEDLEEDGTDLPAFSALHPALDIADSRFGALPDDPALLGADLGALGFVVAGKAAPRKGGDAPALPQQAAVSVAPANRRPKGEAADLSAALAEAAAAARSWGGLPAGALLVVAGLTPPAVPGAGEELAANLGPGLGRARAAFV